MQTSFGNHPYDYSSTRDKLGQAGLTKGFPMQFRYQEVPSHSTYASRESADIHINGDVGIPQIRQDEPLIGGDFYNKPYQDMVYDVPFDTGYDDTINKRLLYFGLSAMSLAGFLL